MPRARRLPLRNPVFAGAVVLIITLLIAVLFFKLAPARCNFGYRTDETVNIHGRQIHLQTARTSKELSEGLGGKSCIGPHQAMLFEFGHPGDYSVWMKGMRFPIDIVWLNSKREVIQINEDVSPKTYPKTYGASQPVNYIIEMKAGQASDLNIQKGDLIKV